MNAIDTGAVRSARTRLLQPVPQTFGRDSSWISQRLIEAKSSLARPAAFKEQPGAGLSLEEQLFNARAICKIRTAQIAMHLEPGRRERFFAQVDSLLDAEEWDEHDQPITEASFATLLRLLLLIRPKRWPGLGATMDGHVIAAWTEDRNRLTIECLPEDQLRWVLVRFRDGERESHAADTPLLRLPTVLQPYEPQIWFGE